MSFRRLIRKWKSKAFLVALLMLALAFGLSEDGA